MRFLLMHRQGIPELLGVQNPSCFPACLRASPSTFGACLQAPKMIERCRQSGGDTLDRAQYLGTADWDQVCAAGELVLSIWALGTRIANVGTVTIVPTKTPIQVFHGLSRPGATPLRWRARRVRRARCAGSCLSSDLFPFAGRYDGRPRCKALPPPPAVRRPSALLEHARKSSVLKPPSI
jgi:hypothetical protein